MTPSPARNGLAGWLCVLPVGVLLVAFVAYQLGDQVARDYRLLLAALAGWMAVLAGLAWAGARRQRGGGARWVALAALPASIAVVAFAGPATVVAGALLALVAIGIGSCIVPRSSGSATALLAGLAVLAAIVGWTLPLPIHHRGAYLLAAVAVLAWRRQALLAMSREVLASARAVAAAHPAWSLLLVAAASVASLGLWLPSLNYDDNAVHLVMQAQLLADARYHFDVQRQAWAVAPWANNVLHAIAAMLAGHEARAAMGAIWLLLGIDGARRLALALGAPVAVALAAAAVFAAQPFTGYFTTTMQVDGASAAILLHLAAIAASPAAARPGPWATGAIGGLLLGLKTVNLLFALPLLAWIAWTSPARGRWLARALAIGLAIAMPNYAYAWFITGNPLFPFFNAVFRSPLYPLENFRDLKWMAGVTWRAPWDLSFRSNLFGQVAPGAAGLALLATLPALFAAARTSRPLAWLGAWAIAVAALLFWQMQYLRYLFPAYAMLVVLGTVALARLAPTRGFVAAVLVLVVVDAALMPTSSWTLQQNAWLRMLREGPGGRAAHLRAAIPERALLEAIMARDPMACVLMADPRRPFVGAGRGRAFSVHRRYDPAAWQARQRAEADPTGMAWRSALAQWRPSHVVLAPAESPVLARVLVWGGWRMQDAAGGEQAWADPAGSAGCGRGRGKHGGR